MTEQTQDRPTTAVAKVPIAFNQQTGMLDLRDIDQVYRLSQFIAAAGWAPKAYQYGKHGRPPDGKTQYDIDVNKVVLGILHGSEVGLSPMASLQSIAVINGTPTIWGDGALALVIKSGLLEDYTEVMTGSTIHDIAWTCTYKRRGRTTPIVGAFSMEDARAANLLGKEGPWQGYPKRMCKMRARAFALRDGFADVLRGLAVAEEVQDYKADEAGVYQQEERRQADPIDMDVAAEVSDQMAETEKTKPAEIEHQPEQSMATSVKQTAQPEPAIVRHIEPLQQDPLVAGARQVEALKESAKDIDPVGKSLTEAHAAYAEENYESEAERVDREAAAAKAAQPKEQAKPKAAEKPKATEKPKHEMSRAEKMMEDQRIGSELLGPDFDTDDERPAPDRLGPATPAAGEPEVLYPGVEPAVVRAELKVGNLRPWLAWFKDELPRLQVNDRPHFIARYSAQIDKIEAERGASWAGLEKALAATVRGRS